MPKILFFITEDWAFLSHRLPLARACRDLGWQVVIATHVTNRADVIAAEGFVLEPLPLDRGGRHPWREARALCALMRVMRRQKPDILHCVAVKPVLYGNLAARLLGHANTVSALAGMGYAYTGGSAKVRLLRGFLSMLLRLLLNRRGHRVIVQNEDDRELLLAIGATTSAAVTLIPGSGVDLEALPALPPPESKPVIFALVARMLADKGVREAVAAMRILKQQDVAAELWLVGAPDPHNPSNIEEAELLRWQGEGLARWLGHQSDIKAIWAAAHVALLPSYREGMPKALLEAAACARPIVTTDVVGCRQVIDDGVEGFKVPARDSVDLAKAMRRLAEDGELRRRMGAAARARAERLFGQERVVEAHLAIYRSLLEQAPCAA
jgi:glycosyltransferase involved in cell wall biosynthesis